jgi:hypothetical protein
MKSSIGVLSPRFQTTQLAAIALRRAVFRLAATFAAGLPIRQPRSNRLPNSTRLHTWTVPGFRTWFPFGTIVRNWAVRNCGNRH